MLRLDTFSDCTVVTAPSRYRRIAAHFANVLAAIRDGGEMRARYEALSRMSNTDLAKRGLTRVEIMRAVLGAER
jgi:uncharacterized protein YjiS (DUF1127 family)